MTIETGAVLAGLSALLCGAFFAWLIMRGKVIKAYTKGQAASKPEIERLREAVAGHETHARQRRIAYHKLENRVVVAEHLCSSIPALKSELASGAKHVQDLQKELMEVNKHLAGERERTSQMTALQEQISLKDRTIEQLRSRLSGQKVELAEQKTRLLEERQHADEKLNILKEAKAALIQQFKVLAQEILDQKGKTFSEQSRSDLKVLLDPFHHQLKEFKHKVDNVYVHEAKQRASLKKEIETLKNLNLQISQEAVNLTRALKGDKKTQGTWGEMILERVLEQSGLRKGIEYDTQRGYRNVDGRLLKPDVIVHLPRKKDIVIDSKVSLIAYERYASTEVESEQAGFLAEHVRAVRNHIDRLSKKDYASLIGVRSLDFVIMFIPIEAAFVSAFGADQDLFSHAFEKRIIAVTSTTLLATLKTVENIWRYERQNKSAQAIFSSARSIYDKLRLFVESMEKLGKQIDSVQMTYDMAMKRLISGKGNVIHQARQFSALGVPIKRPLPSNISEASNPEHSEKA